MHNRIHGPFVVSIALGSLLALTGCVPLGNAGGFVAIQSENPPGYGRPRPGPLVADDFGDRQRKIIRDYYSRREHEQDDRDRYLQSDQQDDWLGRGHEHNHGYGRDDEEDHGRGRRGLPPGLAKRDQLPPGLERQMHRHGTLPPGLRTRPLPRALAARLPPPPEHCVRLIVGTDIVLMNERTRAVLDVIRDVARLSQ